MPETTAVACPGPPSAAAGRSGGTARSARLPTSTPPHSRPPGAPPQVFPLAALPRLRASVRHPSAACITSQNSTTPHGVFSQHVGSRRRVSGLNYQLLRTNIEYLSIHSMLLISTQSDTGPHVALTTRGRKMQVACTIASVSSSSSSAGAFGGSVAHDVRECSFACCCRSRCSYTSPATKRLRQSTHDFVPALTEPLPYSSGLGSCLQKQSTGPYLRCEALPPMLSRPTAALRSVCTAESQAHTRGGQPDRPRDSSRSWR